MGATGRLGADKGLRSARSPRKTVSARLKYFNPPNAWRNQDRQHRKYTDLKDFSFQLWHEPHQFLYFKFNECAS